MNKKIIFLILFFLSLNVLAESKLRFKNSINTSLDVQTRVDFKILIPAFCALVDHNLQTVRQDNFDSGYVNLGPLHYVCNKNPWATIQIESTEPENPTKLLISQDANCKNPLSAVSNIFHNRWHVGFLCAPLNYSPRKGEAKITVINL